MRNVLIITSSYLPETGGQEIGLERMILSLRKIKPDWKITVATPQYKRQWPKVESINDITIFRYPSSLIRYYAKIWSDIINLFIHVIYGMLFLKGYIKKAKPDIIFIYFLLPTAFPSAFFARQLGVPTVVFIGGSDILQKNYLIKRSYKYVFKHAKEIIVTSQHLYSFLEEEFPNFTTKIEQIPYGLDIRHFLFHPKKTEAPVEMLLVQRLVKTKGTETAILAAYQLVKKGIRNFHMTIVGDGPERVLLEKRIHYFQLSGFISIVGNIKNEDIHRYYQTSHIFIFPSMSEGFGIALLEAMATNNIILASRCTSIPEIICHQQNGILFTPGDSSELSEVLQNVLKSVDDYKHLAVRARKDVHYYDSSIVAERIAQILQKSI